MNYDNENIFPCTSTRNTDTSVTLSTVITERLCKREVYLFAEHRQQKTLHRWVLAQELSE